MGHEDWMARNIDRNRGRPERQERPAAPKPPIREPLSEETRALAREFAERRAAEALAMDDGYFISTKSPERRAKDKAEVERLEKKFEHDDESLLASAFEFVIARRLNGPSHWLGEHMQARLTTPFDDYVNKIDLYVNDTRSKEDRPVGLSLDVTFSKGAENIAGKIRDLKEKILDGGRLAQLNYYKPPYEEIQPPTESIWLPKVIVGIDRSRAIESIENLAIAEEEGTEGENRDLKTGLVILYQMTEQLRAYLWYSKNKVDAVQKPHVAATIRRYEDVLRDVEEVFRELKLDHAKVRDFARQSPVTRVIEEQLATVLGYKSEQV